MVPKWLIAIGCLLVVVGVLLHFFPNLFSWFGRLPGDIRMESGRSRIYFPITSMIIISVVLSLVLSFFAVECSWLLFFPTFQEADPAAALCGSAPV